MPALFFKIVQQFGSRLLAGSRPPLTLTPSQVSSPPLLSPPTFSG